MFDPALTFAHSTFILTKSKGLTRTHSTIRRERATKQKEPLNMEMAPVNQRTIGEMELVPSAVGPNLIEQRCQIAEVRMPKKVWSPEARNPFLVLWGRVIDKRARPDGPLVRGPRRASRIPEGDSSSSPARKVRIPSIRKRKRADGRRGKRLLP